MIIFINKISLASGAITLLEAGRFNRAIKRLDTRIVTLIAAICKQAFLLFRYAEFQVAILIRI